MNNAIHLSEEDLTLFALQLLPEAEMQAVALHLKTCAECRGELGRIHGDLVTYAMTAEMKAPPADARERFLSQVAKEKKPVWVKPVAKELAVENSQAAEKADAARKADAPVAAKVEAKTVAAEVVAAKVVSAKVEAAKVEAKAVAAETRTDTRPEPVMFARGNRVLEMDAPEERKRRVAPALAWIGWAVAAGAVAAAGLQFQQRKELEQNLTAETAQLDAATSQAAQSAQAKQLLDALMDKQAMQVSLHVPLTARQQPKADPEGHATYVPGKGTLVFVASHLDPLDPNKTYELWLLPADAKATPIPAGLFKPDANGNASLVMPELPKGVTAKGFGVTVEDDGGSKTPTAPIVLAGT